MRNSRALLERDGTLNDSYVSEIVYFKQLILNKRHRKCFEQLTVE